MFFIENFMDYIFIFFIFSVIGWSIEVTLKFIQFHRFVNRGFLVGPYCPIYGLGSVLIIFINRSLYKFEHSIGLTFLVSILICGLVEYFVSYFLEKKYHARWWDYSKKPMNLNGRIWIGNLILFGLGGLIIAQILGPIFTNIFYKFSLKNRQIISLIIVLIFTSDFIISYFVMKLIKTNIEGSEADNTEDIRKEMKVLVSNKNILYRRFINAYPEVKYRTDKIKQRLKRIEEESKKIREEIEKTIDQDKENLINELQPTSFLKSEIIEKQGRLIELLEDENTSKADILSLKAEIEEKKSILNKRRRIINLEEI